MNASHTAVGSMGSRFEAIRMSRESLIRAADFDWNRLGRRVVLDLAEGLVSWMSPTGMHEKITYGAEKNVEIASDCCGIMIYGSFGSRRWKRLEDPPGTGMEADAAFYVGENARLYRLACDRGEDEEFEDRVPPDLVIEAEAFHGDPDKPDRWADLGVTEMWQLEKGRTRLDPPKAEILGLRPSVRRRSESVLLPSLTPDMIARAVHLFCRGRTDEMKDFLLRAYAGQKHEHEDDGFSP